MPAANGKEDILGRDEQMPGCSSRKQRLAWGVVVRGARPQAGSTGGLVGGGWLPWLMWARLGGQFHLWRKRGRTASWGSRDAGNKPSVSGCARVR